MSNIWRHERVEGAASVGSFAIHRDMPMFTPWTTQDPEPDAADIENFDAAPNAEVAHAEAFAQGFEQGRRTVELEVAAEREAIARLAESLEALRPQPCDGLAALLATTVERLVRQIVGEVSVDPALLTHRAQHAAALLSEETAPARLLVNPDDLPLLDAARIPVPLAADPSVGRGDLRLETGAGWIEDGPSVRLDRLRTELDRMGAR